MTIFSLLESFFFLFLGISFILVLLMVYHFKKKLDSVEKKNETLQDICKTICEELDFVKSQSRAPLIKQPNIDPFYLNYHKNNSDDGKIQDTLPNVSDLFKTIMVSGGGNSIPDALDIQTYENEDLDDVHSYEEDFEYQETDNTDSTVEEVDDFEEQGVFDEIRVYVKKLDEVVKTADDLGSRVEELDDVIESAPPVDELDEKGTGTIADTDDLIEDMAVIDEDIPVKETPFEDTESKITTSKAALQKLTLQMLRTMVIKEGLCTDPSKLKKLELIQMVLDSQ
jgi:hypothetical protein